MRFKICDARPRALARNLFSTGPSSTRISFIRSSSRSIAVSVFLLCILATADFRTLAISVATFLLILNSRSPKASPTIIPRTASATNLAFLGADRKYLILAIDSTIPPRVISLLFYHFLHHYVHDIDEWEQIHLIYVQPYFQSHKPVQIYYHYAPQKYARQTQEVS